MSIFQYPVITIDAFEKDDLIQIKFEQQATEIYSENIDDLIKKIGQKINQIMQNQQNFIIHFDGHGIIINETRHIDIGNQHITHLYYIQQILMQLEQKKPIFSFFNCFAINEQECFILKQQTGCDIISFGNSNTENISEDKLSKNATTLQELLDLYLSEKRRSTLSAIKNLSAFSFDNVFSDDFIDNFIIKIPEYAKKQTSNKALTLVQLSIIKDNLTNKNDAYLILLACIYAGQENIKEFNETTIFQQLSSRNQAIVLELYNQLKENASNVVAILQKANINNDDFYILCNRSLYCKQLERQISQFYHLSTTEIAIFKTNFLEKSRYVNFDKLVAIKSIDINDYNSCISFFTNKNIVNLLIMAFRHYQQTKYLLAIAVSELLNLFVTKIDSFNYTQTIIDVALNSDDGQNFIINHLKDYKDFIITTFPSTEILYLNKRKNIINNCLSSYRIEEFFKNHPQEFNDLLKDLSLNQQEINLDL
jgi:hypothetical protein